MANTKKMLFSLGESYVTKGVQDWMDDNEFHPLFIFGSLIRHATGDWGDIHPDDRGMNEAALEHGNRIFSVYEYPEDKTVIWIITEADRSVTTVLFPDEY